MKKSEISAVIFTIIFYANAVFAEAAVKSSSSRSVSSLKSNSSVEYLITNEADYAEMVMANERKRAQSSISAKSASKMSAKSSSSAASIKSR